MDGFFDYPAPGETGADPDAPSLGTFLAGCSEREWRVLQQHSSIESIARGSALVREGEADQSLFIILAGALSPAPGRAPDASRAHMLPGDVMGELAFFDGLPRSTTVVALEDSRVLRIRYEAFEALAAKEPALARTLLMDLGRALSGRLRAAEAPEAER